MKIFISTFLQVEEGCENELTEFDIKKKEKEEKVAELREKLAATSSTLVKTLLDCSISRRSSPSSKAKGFIK